LDDVISVMRDQLLVEVLNPNAFERVSFLNRAIELFLAARRFIRTDEIPQLPAELAIVELCIGIKVEESKSQKVKEGDFKETGVGLGSLIVSSRPRESDDRVEGSPVVQVVTVEQQTEPQVILNPVVETLTTVPVMETVDEFVLEPVAIAPLPTSESVFGNVPVYGIDEIRRKWPEVFEQVQACNASLPLFLQACEVNSGGDDHVELAFEYDLYVQTVNKEKNRRLVESILERVLGRSVKIRAVLAKAKQKDDVVSSLVDAFGGSTV